MGDLKLSVLDLIPVRAGQSSGQALAASRALAQVADAAGCERYWVAEHHNMPAVASTSPPVLIAMLAAATERVRVGSGGVMLPNHAPLAVAEQFALLEAAHPGRIDLGIGRAPGTDPVTSWALRSGAGQEGDPVQHFPEYVEQVMALLSPGGASFQVGPRRFDMSATPAATSAPPVWLLGSSDYSARLAARLGLPYVFAHHFGGPGLEQAMSLYRSGWQGEGEPQSFLAVNAVVGATQADADRLALPYNHQVATLRTGAPLRPIMTIEQAEAEPLPVPEDVFRSFRSTWLVGTAASVADQARTLASEFDVDEIMIQPVAGTFDADPLDRTPAREDTVRELAAELR